MIWTVPFDNRLIGIEFNRVIGGIGKGFQSYLNHVMYMVEV